MAKYNLEKLHAACVELVNNPGWKDWQVEVVLKLVLKVYDLDEYAEIVEPKNNESLVELCTNFQRAHKPYIFLFANLAGIDIEQFKEKPMTCKSAVMAAIEKNGGKFMVNELTFAECREKVVSLFVNGVVWMTIHVDEDDLESDWICIYTILRLDLTGEYPVEQ